MTQETFISPELIAYASSPKLSGIIMDLSKKHNLHVDQAGYLGSEVRRVLIGKTERKNFTDNIKRRLEIESGLAEKITSDVNTLVFLSLREMFRKSEEKSHDELTDLGSGITLEAKKESRPDVSNHADLDRNSILDGIENPITPSAPAIPAKQPPVPENLPVAKDIQHILENPETSNPFEARAKLDTGTPTSFIDKKLNSSISTPHDVEIKREEPKNAYRTDPYREPLK